ncbi:hypothetical protein UlMin_021855 [Ulmus minor]
MRCCGQWEPLLTMIAINFAFAIVNLLLKKTLDEGMNNLIIVAYRQTISAIFLIPIAYFWERRSRTKLTAKILGQLFFSALIGVTLTQFSFLLGLEYTSATFACAFLNMVPVFRFILALITNWRKMSFCIEKVNLKSKCGRAKILGTLVCVVGALILSLYKGKQLTHSGATENQVNTMVSPKKPKNWATGSVLLATGSCMWSSWFLMQARIGKSYPFKYTSTAILSFFGAIQSSILGLIMERNLSTWFLSGKLEIISVIYAGMIGSGLCYVGMSWQQLWWWGLVIFAWNLGQGWTFVGSLVNTMCLAYVTKLVEEQMLKQDYRVEAYRLYPRIKISVSIEILVLQFAEISMEILDVNNNYKYFP